MTLSDLDWVFSLSRVKSANLSVPASGNDGCAGPVKVQGLDRVGEASKSNGGRGGSTAGVGDIEELDDVITGCSGKNIGSCWVECDLADLSTTTRDACERLEVLDAAVTFALLVCPVELVKVRVIELPETYGSVIACTGDKVVVKGAECGVQDDCGVAAAQRVDVWKLSRTVGGQNGKSSTTGGLPVDGNVFAVGDHEVGVPCIVGDLDVLVAGLLLGGAGVDVSILGWSDEPTHLG